MDDVGEGAGLTADGLDAAGVAAADVVVEEGTGVELGQKVDVVLRQVAVGQNDVDVPLHGLKVQRVQVVAQRVGAVVHERLAVEVAAPLQHLGEALEELGVVERAHAGLLGNIVGEARGGILRVVVVEEHRLGEVLL